MWGHYSVLSYPPQVQHGEWLQSDSFLSSRRAHQLTLKESESESRSVLPDSLRPHGLYSS